MRVGAFGAWVIAVGAILAVAHFGGPIGGFMTIVGLLCVWWGFGGARRFTQNDLALWIVVAFFAAFVLTVGGIAGAFAGAGAWVLYLVLGGTILQSAAEVLSGIFFMQTKSDWGPLGQILSILAFVAGGLGLLVSVLTLASVALPGIIGIIAHVITILYFVLLGVAFFKPAGAGTDQAARQAA
jgi:hypothetical protein